MRSYAEMTNRGINLYDYSGDYIQTLYHRREHNPAFMSSDALRAMLRPYKFSYVLILSRNPFDPIRVRVTPNSFVDADTGEPYTRSDIDDDLRSGGLLRFAVTDAVEEE